MGIVESNGPLLLTSQKWHLQFRKTLKICTKVEPKALTFFHKTFIRKSLLVYAVEAKSRNVPQPTPPFPIGRLNNAIFCSCFFHFMLHFLCIFYAKVYGNYTNRFQFFHFVPPPHSFCADAAPWYTIHDLLKMDVLNCTVVEEWQKVHKESKQYKLWNYL